MKDGILSNNKDERKTNTDNGPSSKLYHSEEDKVLVSDCNTFTRSMNLMFTVNFYRMKPALTWIHQLIHLDMISTEM